MGVNINRRTVFNAKSEITKTVMKITLSGFIIDRNFLLDQKVAQKIKAAFHPSLLKAKIFSACKGLS
jgi:hypothetical protein